MEVAAVAGRVKKVGGGYAHLTFGVTQLPSPPLSCSGSLIGLHEVGLNGWKMRSSALLWVCARVWENELKVNISSTGIYCRIIISMTMTMMFWSGWGG